MAFTEAQKVHISAEILEIDPDLLDLHLESGAYELTTAKQDFIELKISEWDSGIGSDFTEVHPNIKNFGAKITPSEAKAHIRKAIAKALGREDWANSSGYADIELVRG